MSRDDGFRNADVDVGLLSNPKVNALVRRLSGQPGELDAALLLYVAVLLASWGEGRRVTVADAAPSYIDPDPARIAHLQAVGLVDDSGLIPAHAWDGWFGTAMERRKVTRDRWKRAAAAKRESARMPRGVLEEYATPVPTVRPSVPSDPVPIQERGTRTKGANRDDADGWAGFAPEWEPFREAWERRGFHLPPTQAQREVLWGEGEAHGAVRDWPTWAARWVDEASPGASAARVVQYVLSRYHEARDQAARNAS